MKKIIIPLLILSVFLILVLFNYSFEKTTENGIKSSWSLMKLFRDEKGYFKKSTFAELYQNDCKAPLKDDQFIEFQFGDIIFKFPCTVIAHRAGLMIVGDNDGYQKHYYLRMDFKWSKETGLVWWNDNRKVMNEKYKNHNFQVFGRLILKKNSEKTKSDKIIKYSYFWENTRRKNIPEEAELISKFKNNRISIYNLKRDIGKETAKYRDIILKLNNIKDKKNTDITLQCFSIHKDFKIVKFFNSKSVQNKNKYTKVKYKKSCITGWFFEKNIYVELTNLKLENAVYFDVIYKEINSQLESFVKQKKSKNSQIKEK